MGKKGFARQKRKRGGGRGGKEKPGINHHKTRRKERRERAKNEGARNVGLLKRQC